MAGRVLMAIGLLAAGCSPPAAEAPPASEADEAVVRTACGSCHQFPAPDILPAGLWERRIVQMYELAEARGVTMPLSLEAARDWYAAGAPARLPAAPGRTNAGWGPVDLGVAHWRPRGAPPSTGPGTVHVRFASLFGGPGDDVVVSDARHGRVYAIRPYALEEAETVLGEVQGPGRVDVVDLDGDGLEDIVVAGMGEFMPTNERVGSVVWLRRTGPTSFEKHVLASDLGRVADVRAADLNGDGRPDLAVAVFGWRENGQVMWLENVAGEAGDLELVPHVLDARPGSIDVRVADLDGDGRLDIAALLSQEFEQVMVYWGEEDGFRPEAVHQAPHPAWGFSGMEVVDFTGNGRPDLVLTNGDALDSDLARPDHGVGFLENLGGRRFRHHHLTAMYGAYRAVPVDLEGNGRVGLLVAAHLVPFMAPAGGAEPVEALIWLQRVGPTRLVRRVLKGDTPHHLSLDAGDFNGDGRTDFAVAWMDFPRSPSAPSDAPQHPMDPWVSLWRNQGLMSAPADTAGSDVIDWGG